MRADAVLIALSLVLLVMAIVCVCNLRATALDLMEQARAAQDLLAFDPDRAEQEVDALYRRWMSDDTDAAYMALTRTVIALDAVLHKELPTPGNIF